MGCRRSHGRDWQHLALWQSEGAEPPTRERPCKPSVLDPTNTLLSAPISTRSSCPWSSAVQLGSSPPWLRAAARRCPSMRDPAATPLLSWRACPSSRTKHASGRGTSVPSLSFRKRGWTGSGSTGSCNRTGSRAMSSIPPPSRHPGGVGGPRRTGSTVRLWCEPCWPTSGASPGCVRWSRLRRPQEEDRRRISRERETLTAERIRHVNRIKGLLFAQGIGDYEPLPRNRRERLEELITGEGRPLPECLKAQIGRELDRLELLIEQVKAVEAERDAVLARAQPSPGVPAPATLLLALKGVGPEAAATLWSEGLFRTFSNRKQVAAYAGLAPTPWQSGSVHRDQGVSKAGNPRLRTIMIQIAWLWLRHQPQSALAVWFHERIKRTGGRLGKTMIVALARKLLVALWKYATAGVLIEGAVLKPA